MGAVFDTARDIRTGRRPTEKSQELTAWVHGWASNQRDGVVRVGDGFEAAVSDLRVANDRAGRERIRAALCRLVRVGLATNLGGGAYRVSAE